MQIHAFLSSSTAAHIPFIVFLNCILWCSSNTTTYTWNTEQRIFIHNACKPVFGMSFVVDVNWITKWEKRKQCTWRAAWKILADNKNQWTAESIVDICAHTHTHTPKGANKDEKQSEMKKERKKHETRYNADINEIFESNFTGCQTDILSFSSTAAATAEPQMKTIFHG